MDKDLNIKPDALKLIEEKLGNSLEYMAQEMDFLERTLIVQALRLTINKLDLMKLKASVRQRTLSIG